MVCRVTLCSDDTWQLAPSFHDRGSISEGVLKYFGMPVAFTWFMSTKTFDGKKPYGFLKSVIAYALRPKLTYAGKKVTLGRNQPQEAITAVRSEFYGISN